MLVIKLLRHFAEPTEFLSLVHNPLLTSHGSGVYQIGGSVSWPFLCDHSLLSGLLSVVDLGFWSPCNRFESPRTSRYWSPRTPRFVSFDGRRMFSLWDYEDPDVHVANSAWVRFFAVTSEIETLCWTKNSSPVFMYTAFSIQGHPGRWAPRVAALTLKRASIRREFWGLGSISSGTNWFWLQSG